MIDLEQMFRRAVALPSCEAVKIIAVSDREIPVWLHGLGEWESALPLLNIVKRGRGVAVIAGITQVHAIAYIFIVHEAVGKLQANGTVMSPGPGHEECAEAELRVLMHRVRESAAEVDLNFLSLEKIS